MNHEITVCEANQLYGEKGKFRFLQFADNAIQGAIDLNDPKRIVLEYPRAIIHLMKHNRPTFEHVFIIGHGIGTIASHFSEKKCKIAEIEAKVVELSQLFFNYNQNNVQVGDGRQILMEEESHTFDFIVLDAFTKKGTPVHLTNLDFFQLTKQKLTIKGYMIMNAMGKAKNDRLINAIHTTLRESYAFSKVFSLPGEHVSDIRNMIIMGGNEPIDFESNAMAGFIEIELDEGHIII
ncbi:spermidine synthase [compost metagenome]